MKSLQEYQDAASHSIITADVNFASILYNIKSHSQLATDHYNSLKRLLQLIENSKITDDELNQFIYNTNLSDVFADERTLGYDLFNVIGTGFLTDEPDIFLTNATNVTLLIKQLKPYMQDFIKDNFYEIYPNTTPLWYDIMTDNLTPFIERYFATHEAIVDTSQIMTALARHFETNEPQLLNTYLFKDTQALYDYLKNYLFY